MKRKLIRQSGASLTVYLPKNWIDEQGLKPGDEVDISPADDKLVVSAKSVVAKKSTRLKVSAEAEHFVRVLLDSAYIAGYDKMAVEFSSPPQRRIIQDVVDNQLLGFEITDEAPNLLSIEGVAEPSEEKQDALLHKMFYLTKEMLDILNEDIRSGQFKRLAIVQRHAHKFNQYNNFCKRNISKKRFTEPKVHFYWNLYTYLFLMMRAVRYAYVFMEKRSCECSRKTKDILNSVELLYDAAQIGFFKKDKLAIEEVNHKARDLLNDNVLAAIQKTSGRESALLYYIGDMARLIYLSTISMIQVLV